MATAEELMEFYEITKDSKSVKRVNELAAKRDEAVAKNDVSEIANIDSELNNLGGKYE